MQHNCLEHGEVHRGEITCKMQFDTVFGLCVYKGKECTINGE